MQPNHKTDDLCIDFVDELTEQYRESAELNLKAISLKGKIKSFGDFGPKYEVGLPIRVLDDGDMLMHITIVESGEETEYVLKHILEDPEAV